MLKRHNKFWSKDFGNKEQGLWERGFVEQGAKMGGLAINTLRTKSRNPGIRAKRNPYSLLQKSLLPKKSLKNSKAPDGQGPLLTNYKPKL